MLAFGIPLNLLPQKLDQPYYLYGNKGKPELKWYEVLYNKTIGSEFYQNKLRQPLEKITGGTLHLFSSTQSSRTFTQSDPGVKLYISAKLTEKGDAEELNQKMWQMDHFLAEYKEIERFVTQVKGESGTIEVEFTDEYKYGAFPRHLESQVIKKRYQ